MKAKVTNKRKLIPLLAIFMISGLIYVMLEILWRGYSHWTMFVCAGVCGIVMMGINDGLLKFDTDFRIQVVVSAFLCTTAELIFGLIFNSDFTIWDYRDMIGTIHCLNDQINIFFILIWGIISVFGLPFLDWMQWKLGLGPRPYYRIGDRKIYLWRRRS